MAKREFNFGDPSREIDQRLNLLMSREYAQVGEVPMVAGGFGDFYEYLDDVTSSIPPDHPDREGLIAGLTNLGFAGGFKNREFLSPSMSEYFERMGLVGAGAARDVMQMKGWDGADVLVVASSSSNVQVPEIMIDELRKQGIVIDSFQMTSQACNSAASAVSDLGRHPDFSGRRAIVLGIESLSGSAVDQSDYVTRHVFGNAYGALCFVPGVDLVHISGVDTVIEQDRAGVIRAPHAFQVENKGDIGTPMQPPPWYTVVGEIDPGFWHTTSRGNFINLPTAPNLTMDGPLTYQYFSSRVPARELAALEQYYAQYYGKNIAGRNLGELGATVAHMPSFLVHSAKCAFVERGKKKRQSESPSSYPDFQTPSSPWLMDRTGLNNSSAATLLVNMTHMAKENMILPGKPFLFEGYGAGSAISANVMMIT